MAVAKIAATKIAVAGVSGYAGAELARLLLQHPGLQDTLPLFLGRMQETAAAKPIRLADMHPQLAGMPRVNEVEVGSWDWSELEREGV